MQGDESFTQAAIEQFRRQRNGRPIQVFGANHRRRQLEIDVEPDLPQFIDHQIAQNNVEKSHHFSTYHDHPVKQNGGAKTVLLCIGIAFLLILSIALGTWLLTHAVKGTAVPHHAVQNNYEIAPAPAPNMGPSLVQDISEGLQNIRVFYFQFTTGTQIQSRERYPPAGGIPNITIHSLMDYNVCCSSQDNRFVCAGGTAFSGNGMFMEAYLEKDESDDEVYLLLWINSNDLIEVGCWLRGTLAVN
jgi:hypothetical protein